MVKDKWQLIEESSPPTDGETRFLAWAPDTRIMAVCFMKNISTAEPIWVCTIPDFDFEYGDHPKFKMWIPLPEAP